MYNLPYFKESDHQRVLEFMKQYPFAMLIGCDGDRPAATQVPILFEERDSKLFLRGHMMRKQDHHLAFTSNPNVLVVFTGPHTYVSAAWYDDPHQASTWNYMSVHARGKIHFLDEKGLEEVLRKLTLKYERGNHQSPTVFDNLSEEYRAKLLPAIVAFEIEVATIDNVFKLSQNRDEKSYHNIMDKLTDGNADEKGIADAMEKRAGELFKK